MTNFLGWTVLLKELWKHLKLKKAFLNNLSSYEERNKTRTETETTGTRIYA